MLRPILISWPTSYADWLNGNSMTNSQHAWQLWSKLRERYDNVSWVNWGEQPQIPDGARLYTHTSWPVGSTGIELMKRVKEKGGQVYAITNDPLQDYVVEHGAYNLHGYNGFNNAGENHSVEVPNWYAKQQLAELQLVDVMFCHTNEVGLKRWAEGCKARQFRSGFRFVPFLSPIDKSAFYREFWDWKPKKFLVMRGVSSRKRQQDFKHLYPNQWVQFPTENWSWLRTDSYRGTLAQCSCLAHPSLQEGFPYFAAEAMCKGLLLLGGEDWWDGYGREELIWRQGQNNDEKIRYLSSPDAAETYGYVLNRFHSRRDNEWNYVMDNLFCKEVEELPIA